jgi:hypothetical protein
MFGDKKGDGKVDKDDVEGFSAALFSPEKYQVHFDYNHDKVVNGIDLHAFLSMLR